MALTASIEAAISAVLSGAPDLGTAKHEVTTRARYSLTDGTGANQANNLFTDQRTLTASSTENLDLAGGVTNALGATLTFTAIKAILIKAAAGNTNNVVVGGAGSNTFVGPFADATDKISIPPGGCALLVNPSAAGWAVTASTGDILLVANGGSGTPVTYDIVIVGEA